MADQQKQAWSNIFAKRPPPGPADKAVIKKHATSKPAAAPAPPAPAAAARRSETPDQAADVTTTNNSSSSSKVRPSSALLCLHPNKTFAFDIYHGTTCDPEPTLLQSVKYNKDGLFADPQRRAQHYKEIKPKIVKVSYWHTQLLQLQCTHGD